MKANNEEPSVTKESLRKEVLAERRALSVTDVKTKSHALMKNIKSLPEYQKAHRVMAFLAMGGESNLDDLIRDALKEGKEIYIPVCRPERQLDVGRLHDMEHFERGPLGLRNLPHGYEPIEPEELDLVLIPGVACDLNGTRLGMGAGYYDRFLSRVDLKKRFITLWDFQVVSHVPCDPWDEKMTAIVTDKRIIRI